MARDTTQVINRRLIGYHDGDNLLFGVNSGDATLKNRIRLLLAVRYFLSVKPKVPYLNSVWQSVVMLTVINDKDGHVRWATCKY